jgi:hypothetical protein
MIAATELAMMVKQTAAFIAADATEITLTPRDDRVSDGAGGWVDTPGAPLAPISVRLIPQSDKVPEAAVVEGRRAVPDMILMAMPGVDIKRYDRFSWNGKVWKISHIHDKPEYEFKADVVVDAG